MRYGLLVDIHANAVALEKVVAAIRAEGVDAFHHVGDVVGYGAQPAECLQILRDLSCEVVCGNHDAAVVGTLELDYFNPFAREAVLWTRATLSQEDRDWLAALPLIRKGADFTLVHGTPYAPEMFHYLQSIPEAERSFQALDRPVCFVGHSHVPVAFFGGRSISYSLDPEITVEPEGRTLVNIGSVGQPRDDDTRAAYAIYDTEKKKVWIRRVQYDVDAAAAKILAAGLPEILGERLRWGR